MYKADYDMLRHGSFDDLPNFDLGDGNMIVTLREITVDNNGVCVLGYHSPDKQTFGNEGPRDADDNVVVREDLLAGTMWVVNGFKVDNVSNIFRVAY